MFRKQQPRKSNVLAKESGVSPERKKKRCIFPKRSNRFDGTFKIQLSCNFQGVPWFARTLDFLECVWAQKVWFFNSRSFFQFRKQFTGGDKKTGPSDFQPKSKRCSVNFLELSDISLQPMFCSTVFIYRVSPISVAQQSIRNNDITLSSKKFIESMVQLQA